MHLDDVMRDTPALDLRFELALGATFGALLLSFLGAQIIVSAAAVVLWASSRFFGQSADA